MPEFVRIIQTLKKVKRFSFDCNPIKRVVGIELLVFVERSEACLNAGAV